MNQQNENSQSPSHDGTTAFATDASAEAETTTSTTLSQPHETIHASGIGSDMANFFARPVLVPFPDWTTSTTWHTTFTPFTSWASNVYVARKLSDWRLFRGTMHVSLNAQGSPNSSGLLRVSFRPVGGPNVFAGSAFYSIPYDPVTINGWVDYPQLSQYPHVDLEASLSTKAEFQMPFVHKYNWIDLTNAQSRIQYVFAWTHALAQLRGVNGTPPSVPIVAYVWFTDVELSVPLVNSLSMPMKGKKKVKFGHNEFEPSSVLSNVATYASTIGSTFPSLAPLATPISIAANMGSTVAAMFGYAVPTSLESPVAMLMRATGRHGLIGGLDNSVKLACDPKNTVSVDPSLVPFGTKDDQSLLSLAQRWTTIAIGTWTTQAAGTAILTLPVTPFWTQQLSTTATGANTIGFSTTSLAFVSYPFRYWSGCIKYRLKFYTSAYHRGMIRIRYSPLNAAPIAYGGVNDPSPVGYSAVYDLQIDGEIEFEVPWSQSIPYQRNLGPVTGNVFNGVGNGVLVVEVLAPLNAPTMPPTVDWTLDIAAGSDYRLRQFDLSNMNGYTFTSNVIPLSFELASKPTRRKIIAGDCIPVTDQDPAIMFGERVETINSLCKKWCPNFTWKNLVDGTQLTGRTVILTLSQPVGVANRQSSLVGMPTDFMNNVYHTPYTWFFPAFLAQRGSKRFKFVTSGRAVGDALATSVAPASTTQNDSWMAITHTVPVYATQPQSSSTPATWNNNFGYTGILATASESYFFDQDEIAAGEIPYLTPAMWDNAACYPSTSAGAIGDRPCVTYAFNVCGGGASMPIPETTVCFSCGDDFGFYGFLGAPILYTRISV